MVNPDRFTITHAIVTANIYKYFFDDPRYRTGELRSGQTASNTYMFDLKYTTRNDGEAMTPSDWQQFDRLPRALNDIAARHGLPQ